MLGDTVGVDFSLSASAGGGGVDHCVDVDDGDDGGSW